MRSPHLVARLAPLVLSLPLCDTPAAQVPFFIVDEQGGPGAHFTDLPEAVAAVPDGSVLRVRPGAYTAFVVSRKGLAVIGDDRDTVRIARHTSTPAIAAVGPQQRFLVQNVTVERVLPHPFSIIEIRIEDCQGPVIFENVTGAGGYGAPPFVALRSANVQLHRCELQSWEGDCLRAEDSSVQISESTLIGGSGQFMSSPTCMTLVRSRCVAVASRVAGGDGRVGGLPCGLFFPSGSAGGDAVDASDGSSFVSLRTPVGGGLGGVSLQTGPTCAETIYWEGGDGIVLSGGSTARFEGASPSGGAAVVGSGAASGAPSVVSGGSAITIDPSSLPPSATVAGTLIRGAAALPTLAAEPASAGVLLLSYDGALLPLEPFYVGSLLWRFVLALPPVLVPAGGTAAVPLTIPAAWPVGRTIYGQFVTLSPTGLRIWVTNSFSIQVNE